MILQNVVARFQVVRISVERGKRNYVRSLTQSAVARTDEKAAGESAFEVKATALVAGNQAHGDAATALQVGDHAAIRAANWLKVSAEYSHLNAQTTWPFGKELKANRVIFAAVVMSRSFHSLAALSFLTISRMVFCNRGKRLLRSSDLAWTGLM